MAGGLMSTVRAQFTATAAGFRSTIQQIGNDTRSIGTNTENAVRKSNSAFSSLGGMITKIGSAYLAFRGITDGLGALGRATIGANADMETYQNTLTTLMGSQKKATETLDWAVKFAAQTPFEIPGIVDATAKLTSYGIDATKVMTDIGNMASVMGKPLDQAIEAVADAQTGELERLKEFGITKQMLIDEAQKLYGKELVNSKGQITDQELLNQTLFAIMKQRYDGGMDIASKSFKGIVSNIQDAFGTMARELSKPIFDKLKSGLAALAPVVSAAVLALRGDWQGVKDELNSAFGPDTALKIENFFLAIGSWVNEAKQYIAKFAPTVENIMGIIENLFPILQDLGLVAGGAVKAVADELPNMAEGLTGIVEEFTAWEGFAPIVEGVTAAMGVYELTVTAIEKAQALWNTVQKISIALQGAWRAAMIASAAAGGGLTGVIAGVRAAFTALNGTMALNPIALVIAIIAGLVVAFISLYKHSETFRNIVDGVWKAIKDGLGAALQWITTEIPKAWNWLMDQFNALWNWMKSFFSKWGTTILAVVMPFIGIPLLIREHWDEISAWLAGIWEAIKSAVMTGVNYVVGLWNQLVAFVTPIIMGFVNSIVTAWNNFVTNIMTIINPIINFFVNTWENIKLFVLSIVGLFLNLLLGNFDNAGVALQGIWAAITRQLENVWNTIKEIGLAVFNILMNGLSKIWDTIKTTASNVWTAIKDTASKLWNDLKTTVLNAVTNLKNDAINKFNQLKTDAINAWNNLKAGAIQAAENLKTDAINKFNQLKTDATNAVNNTKTAVVNGFNSAKDSAISTVTNMYNKVVEWFTKIPQKAKETGDSIVRTFKSIDLTQIGRDIINGLWNGLAGAAKKVYDKAQEIANGITSKIRKALDTHSPSRVMEDIGLDTGGGLIVGMDGIMKKVRNAAGKLASAIQTPFTGNVVANAGSAVMESIQTIKHVIDLKNVPSHIDADSLVDMLHKSIGNPKLQKTIDRINYKNNYGAKMPLGRA